MGRTFAQDSLLNALAGFATMASGLLGSVIIARLLGVEGVGVFSFAIWVVALSQAIGDLGVPSALMRYLPVAYLPVEDRPDVRRQEAKLIKFLRRPFVVVNLVIAAGFITFGIWIARETSGFDTGGRLDRDHPMFWILVGIAVAAQSCAGFAAGYLRGQRNFARLMKLSIVSASIQLAVTAVAAGLFGIAGAMAGVIAGNLVWAVVTATAGRPIPSPLAPIEPDMANRIQKFAAQTWGSTVLTAFAWSRMEIFFLERSAGSEAVGLFSVSLTMANLATHGPFLITAALLPHLALRAGSDSQRMGEAYAAALRLLALIVFPSCLGLAAIAPLLIPLVFGAAFAAAVPSAEVLLLASAISATAQVAFTTLLAREHTGAGFALSALGAVLSIAAGLIIIPAFGVMGAAGSRAIIQCTVSIAAMIYIAAVLGYRVPLGNAGRLFAASLVCYMAARLAVLSVGGIGGVVIAVLFGAVAYAVAVRLFGALNRSDADRLIGFADGLAPMPGSLIRRLIDAMAAPPRDPR